MSISKILVVDDEKPIYSYLQKKFTKLGYTALTAEDGEEAVASALANLPDLIILDVKLPKLNGIEVCRRLKADAHTKNIPILMLSAKAQSSEIREGLEAGADKYLCKPISFPELLREVRAYDGLLPGNNDGGEACRYREEAVAHAPFETPGNTQKASGTTRHSELITRDSRE